jgi:hypothetical protein
MVGASSTFDSIDQNSIASCEAELIKLTERDLFLPSSLKSFHPHYFTTLLSKLLYHSTMQISVKIIVMMIAATLIAATPIKVAPACETTSLIAYENICINIVTQIALVAAARKQRKKDQRSLELRSGTVFGNSILYARAVSMIMKSLERSLLVGCTSVCWADTHVPR